MISEDQANETAMNSEENDLEEPKLPEESARIIPAALLWSAV